MSIRLMTWRLGLATGMLLAAAVVAGCASNKGVSDTTPAVPPDVQQQLQKAGSPTGQPPEQGMGGPGAYRPPGQ